MRTGAAYRDSLRDGCNIWVLGYVPLGKAIAAVHLLGAGNLTHTPGSGALMALGVLAVVKRLQDACVPRVRVYRQSAVPKSPLGVDIREDAAAAALKASDNI